MQAIGAAQPSWLGIARVLTPHTAQVSSLDFSKDGEWLLSSGEDSRLCLYSTTRGELQRVAMCAPYGATLARFTHDSLSVVTASPEDHVIRYMSLHENRYLRNFRAHTDKLVALEMSPKEDIFTSASMDGTARMWDLRTTDCQGVMRFPTGDCRPAVAFDPQGLVFAAATGGSRIALYDMRSYDKGPFVTFGAAEFRGAEGNGGALGSPKSFGGIRFSNDGQWMLLSTTEGAVHLIDAYSGLLARTYTGHSNEQRMPLEASFTPDGGFVLSGSEDGAIWRWDRESGASAVLREHSAPVTCIKCNPTRLMLASACTSVCLWLPP
jgi:COMPASS component SWD2